MGDTGAIDLLPATSSQEVDSTQEADATPGSEGVGVTEGRWLCWWTVWRTQAGDRVLLPSPVRPKRWVTFENPRDTEMKQVPPSTTTERQSQEVTGSWSWPWGDESKDF